MGIMIPFCQSDVVCSRSLTVMNRFVKEVIMTSPPNFRNSFGIPSRPTALPDIMTFLEDKNVLGESQGAFRKKQTPRGPLFHIKRYMLPKKVI
jgi:hypothetical protein